jgi:hypothetical protein
MFKNPSITICPASVSRERRVLPGRQERQREHAARQRNAEHGREQLERVLDLGHAVLAA